MEKQRLFSISKSGTFYLKPQTVRHWDSAGRFTYNSKFDGYDVQHALFVRHVQIFFLWFIFNIDLEPKTEGYGKETYKIYREPSKVKEI